MRRESSAVAEALGVLHSSQASKYEAASTVLGTVSDIGSYVDISPDESMSVLSREITPATLGFLPLTRESTPLHSGFNLPLTREVTPLHSGFNGFNGGDYSMELGIALQRLYKQHGKNMLGTELDTGFPSGAEQLGLNPAHFLLGSSSESLKQPLDEVSEEASNEVLPQATSFQGEAGALWYPQELVAEEAEGADSGDTLALGAAWSKPLKDDLLGMNFISTPESTPLHLGFLSTSTSSHRAVGLSSNPLQLGALRHSEEAGQMGVGYDLDVPPPPGPPVDEGLPSVGSAGHPLLCARPCKYAGKPRGCKDGRNCLRCHMCQWRRVSEKQAVNQQALRAVQAMQSK